MAAAKVIVGLSKISHLEQQDSFLTLGGKWEFF